MFDRRFRSRFFTSVTPAVRSGRRKRVRQFHPRLELLEQRCLLSISPAAPSVVSRLLFYNDSFFTDAFNDPSFNHDTAIATDKVALVSGAGKSTFANISTYDKGINGIMVDLPQGVGDHAAITATDFVFKTSGIGSSGVSNDPSTWTTVATAPTVTVRPSAGSGGSDRIELTWPAGTILDTWLQVTVKANPDTGLGSDDQFYFGSLPGDTNNDQTADFRYVDAADQSGLQTHSNITGSDLFYDSDLSTAIQNLFDVNRDDQIDAADQSVARTYAHFPLNELDSININAPPAPVIAAALANDTGPNNQNNSDGITKDATISGTFSGPNPISSLFVSLNSNGPLEESSLVQSDGSFTVGAPVLTALNGGQALPDGVYTLRLQATDSQGASAYTMVAFTLKRSISAAQVPDLLASSDSGASDTDNITNVTTPTVSLTAEAGSLVSLIVDGQTITSFTANPTVQYTLPALSNTTHAVRIRAQDGAGNSSFSPILSLTVSNVLPTVTAAANVTISSDVTPHLTVNASSPLALANGTVAAVDVDLNNDGDFNDPGEFDRTETTLFAGQSYFQITPALPYTDPQAGPYMVNIRVRVSDIAGNEGTSAVQALKMDTLANDVLKNYVQTSDPTSGWSLNSTLTGAGYTSYVFDLRSQTWRTTADVNLPLWHEWLQIIIPDGAINNSALLYIHGGANTNSAPTTTDPSLVGYALQSHSVIVDLPMVPSEPLVFTGDPDHGRSEDAIIAYTFNQYLTHLGEPGNDTWPALLPMVKAAVRAMDATQAIVPQEVPGGHVDNFVVTGYSKRGWTTWLTAAVDNRVKAIIPGVFDNLNVGEQMVHHYGFYGAFAPSLNDYTAFNLPQDSFTDTGIQLAPVIDPYRYLNNGRFDSMPKLEINSAGYEFFVPDSSQFYFSDIPGTKNYLRYIPNVGHGLNNVDPVNSTASFYDAVINDRQLPQFAWTMQQDGSIRVQTATTPTNVVMWQATNPNARDFRYSVTGINYTSSPLNDLGGGLYIASLPAPATGATAFFVQLTFPSAIPGNPYIFTTEIKVLSASPLVPWPFYMPTFTPPSPGGAPGPNSDAQSPDLVAIAPALVAKQMIGAQQSQNSLVAAQPVTASAATDAKSPDRAGVASPDASWQSDSKAPTSGTSNSLSEAALELLYAADDDETI